jgi:hypothetical protein
VTATWTPEHARSAHHAAREDLARRISAEQAVEIALRRTRVAWLRSNGWSIEEVAQVLACGHATTERDLAYMRELERRGTIARAAELHPPRICARDRVHPPMGPRARVGSRA